MNWFTVTNDGCELFERKGIRTIRCTSASPPKSCLTRDKQNAFSKRNAIESLRNNESVREKLREFKIELI